MAKQSEYSKQNILNIEDMEQDLIEVFTLYYGEQMREHIESVFNQTLFVFGDEHTPQHIEDSVKFLSNPLFYFVKLNLVFSDK